MCFSHIQVKLTHVIQKCSTGPQIIYFVKVLFNSIGQRDCYCAFCLSGVMLFQMKYQDFSMKMVLGILILFVFLFCCQFLLQQGGEQGAKQGGEVDGDAGEPLGDVDIDGPKEVMGSCEILEQVMEVRG